MRRHGARTPFRVVLALVIAAGAAGSFLTPPANATLQPSVIMTLARQTPWVTPKSPRVIVGLTVTNSGSSALGSLSVVSTLSDAVSGPLQYDESLTRDVTTQIQSPQTAVFPGTLDPGATRTFDLTVPLPALASRLSASLIYPLKIDLVSGTTIEAEMRTPIIDIVKKPKTPLNLSWTWVLGAQIGFGPNGTFTSSGLVRALGPGGPTYDAIQALRSQASSTGPSVDVAVAPMLLEQLARMSRGFTVGSGGKTTDEPATGSAAVAAATALQALHALATGPNVELSSLPYSSPNLPSLLSSGLSRDLPGQLSLGTQTVARLAGATPLPSILRPPGGAIDPQSASRVRAAGVRILLVDPATTDIPPQPNGFAGPAVVRLSTGSRTTLSLVQPDPGVQALVTSPTTQSDPRLSAQEVLGELAAIWMEEPSTPRGSAMMLDTAWNLPGTFSTSIADLVARAPWLKPVTASGLVGLADKLSPPPIAVSRINTPRYPSFPSNYSPSISQAKMLVSSWASMSSQPASADGLNREILLAEAGQYLRDTSTGRAWVADTISRANTLMSQVHALPSQVVTLASTTGTIPLRMANTSGVPLTVQVQLDSPRLRFSAGNPQTVLLRYPEQTLIFRASAQTTGTFPVQILVSTLSGHVLAPQTLVVRSRAFSRLALLITLSAFAFLLLMWARRSLHRRRVPRRKTRPANDAR